MIAAMVINIKQESTTPMTGPEGDPAASKRVQSNQRGLHPNLSRTVRRHLETEHNLRPADHNLRAFEALARLIEHDGRPLILDSFCGTGHSTRELATRYPDHLVVGVDKSAHRLQKHPGPHTEDYSANYTLLQAECEPLWQLLEQENIRLARHYLLYPNPWPKSGHLKRRIHGHPGFRYLLALEGKIEVRSNWQLYVEEFGAAVHIAGFRGRVSALAPDGAALTLFERKYLHSGHDIWVYRCTLPGGATARSS